MDGITAAEKHKIEDEIDMLENKIAALNASKNADLIKKHVEDMCSIEGTFSNNRMWKLKQKVYARSPELPTAKKDPETDALITNPKMLKDLNLKIFKNRLKTQEIMPYLNNLKNIREELLNIRLQTAKLKRMFLNL